MPLQGRAISPLSFSRCPRCKSGLRRRPGRPRPAEPQEKGLAPREPASQSPALQLGGTRWSPLGGPGSASVTTAALESWSGCPRGKKAAVTRMLRMCKFSILYKEPRWSSSSEEQQRPKWDLACKGSIGGGLSVSLRENGRLWGGLESDHTSPESDPMGRRVAGSKHARMPCGVREVGQGHGVGGVLEAELATSGVQSSQSGLPSAQQWVSGHSS